MRLTSELCEDLIELYEWSLPQDVAKEARRSMLNVLGTAIGASAHPAVEAIVEVGQEHAGNPVAPVPGREERLGLLYSATAFGLAAHLDDFDDTHLETVIHPSAATFGAILPLALDREATGHQVLTAFALGCEAQLRIGAAMSPWHYDEGWHITGTCGVLGAAVAAGLLVRLDPETLAQALGIAASQTLGHREAFGTAIKPFHPGKAAANGVLAVLLAERGFTGSNRVLEAPRGFFAVLSPRYDAERVTGRLGEEWELLRNTYKPYPCGIVSHPAIDAAVALSSKTSGPEEISRVTVHCHELVPELTGNPAPSTGLEARFSTIHGVAAGLADGRVGIAQYQDSRVTEPKLSELRGRIRLQVDGKCARDAAALEVELKNGDLLYESVEHARGSLARPLTDVELQEKVGGLVEPVLPGATRVLVDWVADLSASENLQQLDQILSGHGRKEVQS